MQLKDNQEISSIHWDLDGADSNIAVGEHDCLSLRVSMQLGQMSLVPWVEATYPDGKKVLHNAATMTSIVLPVLARQSDE